MKVIYVDESGNHAIDYPSRFFIVVAVIIDIDDFDHMEKTIQLFKNEVFGSKFKGNEIHSGDIIRGENGFEEITEDEKTQIFAEVFTIINSLEFSIITVAVDKHALKPSQHIDAKILDMAYGSLMTRLNMYLRKIHDKGIILMDRTSSKPHALNKTDTTVMKTIKEEIKRGTSLKGIKNIISAPQFIDSKEETGIQIADLVAYCTNRFLNNKKNFREYWDLIYPKIQTGEDGKVDGYGLTKFPQI